MKKVFTSFALLALAMPSIQAQVTRNVIIEEFTGTWCPNCPDGHTILKGIETANPGRAIAVGMHNNDQFTIPYEVAIENAFAVAGFPRAAIDRIPYSGGNANVMSRSFWAGAVAARLNVASPVELSISPSLNNATRELTVTVNYDFKADVTEETRLTCVVLEDNIVANQSGGSATYVHYDVCRALLSADNWGDANHPSSVTTGQSFSKVYNYTIPAGLDLNNLRIVAFINKKIGTAPAYGTGTEILNAAEAKVFNAPLTVANTQLDNATTQCSPNPFTDITAIDFSLVKDGNVNAYVTDVNGRKIQQLINEKRSAGKQTIFWGGDSDYGGDVSNGIYYINIISEGNKLTKPVVLQK
jgi:Outer membrane protein Omp28